MTDGLIRSFAIARSMNLDPLALALCPDAHGIAGQPFTRSKDRWQRAATRAALPSSTQLQLHNQERPR